MAIQCRIPRKWTLWNWRRPNATYVSQIWNAYLGDLQQRRGVIQEMIDAKVVDLTTNREWERFLTTHPDAIEILEADYAKRARQARREHKPRPPRVPH